MKKILFILTILLLASCSQRLDFVGMVAGQSPVPDIRFEESMKYNEQNGSRDLITLTDTYRFYVGTDTHIDSAYDHTAAYLRAFRNDLLAPFTLMLGDMINANGKTVWVSELIREQAGLKQNLIYPTLGNHDAYFNQWHEWQEQWGTSTYSFVVRTPLHRDLYICLESANGTLGKKQLKWLQELLDKSAKENYRHIIVFSHTHLFKKDASQGHTSNFAIEETQLLTELFSKYGVDWYLCGHDHSREITKFKGVTYITVDALEEHYPNAYYMIATVGSDLRYEFVPVGEHDDN